MQTKPGIWFVVLASFIVSLLIGPAVSVGSFTVRAQEASTLSCEPSGVPASPVPTTASTPNAVALPDGAIKVKVGYVTPVSIFAPLFVAKEKGYFAEQGLDVTLESIPTGSDLVALTATGEFDAGIGGVGPAFWNAMAGGLPLSVIAPGHAEGNPVATPLMISKSNCESGAIKSVEDLRGKKVSVNGPGATEYWLGQALGTAGMSLDDVDLQFLPFADAVAALQSGAIAGAMIGEPLATAAEQNGIGVRLLTDFPVQDVQPTEIYGNQSFLDKNPKSAAGLVTAYLKACREMASGGFDDPTDLAIIEQYTGVPADLVTQAVRPVYAVDGQINLAGLSKLQSFFRERDQLEYDTDLDPATFVDTQFVDAALQELGPA